MNTLLRVSAAVPKVSVANCAQNRDALLALMKEADREEADVAVFPELSLSGYTAGDLFLQTALLENAEKALQSLLKKSEKLSVIGVVGLPLFHENGVYNTAAVFQKGRLLGLVPKTFVPNYGEFYEKRWFRSSSEALSKEHLFDGQAVPFGTNLLFAVGQTKFAVEICEDLWAPIPPSARHAQHGAEVILNLSASNEVIGKHAYRRELAAGQSARLLSGYVLSSSGVGESTSDLVFGGFGLIAENGIILKEGGRFAPNTLVTADIDTGRLLHDRMRNATFSDNTSKADYETICCEKRSRKSQALLRFVDPKPFVPSDAALKNERAQEIFQIQTEGLRSRMEKTGMKSAVIGISGGLDSTLALLVTVNAFDKLGLDRKQMLAVTMPGFGTTDRTYQNALALAKALGVTLREIPIGDACLKHFSDIGHDPSLHDAVYENTQARERTQILMDLSNEIRGLVVGTGDLSELALGWATYNGDHMSMYGVNAGVPKTLVQYLVRYVSETLADEKTKAILTDILDTPISPELLPADDEGKIAQKTEELVGPYELHDFFLYYFLRFGYRPKKILCFAEEAFRGQYNKEEILHWLKIFLKRFFSQQFKRNCLPDGPKVGSVNLSPRGDWRMPSDADVKEWLSELES